MSLRRGDVVMGRYRIMGALAEGGMGMVYLARVEGAEGFSRPAVIKQILPTLSKDDEMVRMFVREARILSSLHHPNIVSVLDFASEGGTFLMALEYVHGYGVNQWLKYQKLADEQMPAAIAVWIVAQVLDALHYAHTRTDAATGSSLGIVHRDVSLSNILLDVEGHVRLVDFGVAREMSENTAPKPGEVSVRGKFPYMAPELLSGVSPSARSDLYACGVTLHELLTGDNELRDRDPNVTIKRVFMHDLSKVSAKRDDVRPELDALIAKATAKDPEARFESAEEMANALRGYLTEREAQLQQELRALLHADFLGEMPAKLNITPLATLEEAWRSASPTPPSALDEKEHPARMSDNPTQSAPRVIVESGGGAMRWVLGVAVLLALASSIGVLVFVMNGPSGGTERVLVVERRRLDDPAAESAAIDAGSDAGAVDEEPSAPRTRAQRLTRAFTRQQPRLRRCFEQHALTLQGRPRIAIRFSIGVSGSVERAELTPSELSGTALGQCLLAVANDTRFGAQPDPITFSIPIAVRAR